MAKINDAVASKGFTNPSITALQSSSSSFASSGASSPSGSGTQTPTTSTDRTLVGSPKLGASPRSSTFSSTTLGGGRSSSPHRAMSKSQTILTAGLDSRTGLPVGHPPTLPESVYNYLPKVVNYSGSTVVDQSERKRIASRHFVMLTVSLRVSFPTLPCHDRMKIERADSRFLSCCCFRSEAEEISSLTSLFPSE